MMALRQRLRAWIKPRMIRRGHRRQGLLDWEDHRFDRAHGISTTGLLWPADGTVVEGAVEEGNVYAPERLRTCRLWLRELPSRLSDFTFIDMGSGKGRVLFVAAVQAFGMALGVEYVEELHDAAVANIAAFQATADAAVVATLGDATKFEFPLGPLVVHFNNPFREPIMERVIENLTKSYELAPRPIVAVYHQAWAEPPQGLTRNVALLTAAPVFATHRLLSKTRLSDRLLLGAYRTDVFESREARDLR